MKNSDKPSYNLKMRTSTRREPRVEETVVYHWGRILGVLVSLLLIAFVAYWFFLASPGPSTGGPIAATDPVTEDSDVGSSISGTIQRNANEPAPGSDTEMMEPPAAGQPGEDSSPFATTAPQQPDSSPDAGSGTESDSQVDSDQPGTGQNDIGQAEDSDTDSVPSSTVPGESEMSAADTQTDTNAVAGAGPESSTETTSAPPESVIDDPADRPAPTDDPAPAATTSDADTSSDEDSMAQLDIASEHLQRVQLTWEVRDREPTTALPATINLGSREVIRVYFFNELQGLKGQTIYHDWYLNGDRVARVDINAFLDRMRASSGKYINQEMLGDWRVEAVTESGTVLGSGSFSVVQ